MTVGGSGTTLSPYTIAPTAAGSATLNITIGSGAGAAGQFGIINWSGFDIAAGNTVAFAGAGNLAFSVLNRVQGAMNPTVIAGALTGNAAATVGNRGTIFVINEAGISFANSATVTNLTGFIASSLDVLDTDFVTLAGTPGSPIRFATSTALGTGTGTGAGSVHIDMDGATKATIAPDSVLLLVAPKLDLQGGALAATHTEPMSAPAYGDAGVVLASDATVALNPDSIISIKIDKGTAISGSVLNGTVGGQRVLIAAASSTNLMASLLGVGGNLTATTVSATDHGIVIAAGVNAAIDGVGNNISFTAPATPAVVGTTGILASNGRVDVIATDALTIGPVIAMGPASFTSQAAALILNGSISAVGDLTASGTSITLGATGAAHGLTATAATPALGGITLTASGGGAAAITTLGSYSINAAGPVVLQQSVGTPANVTQNDSLAITGSSVSVGNIALATTLPAAFGTGDVVLTANGSAMTDAVVAGTVAAQSGVTVKSTSGAATLGGAISGGGVGAMPAPQDVTVTAAGVATVSGAVTSTGNYTVTGGDVTLGGAGIAQAAAGDVLVRAVTHDITGTGTLTADSGGVGDHLLVLDAGAGKINAPLLNLSAGTLSNVYLNTAGNLALGTINANEIASATLGAMPSNPPLASDYAPTTANTVTVPGAISLGAVTTVQPVTIASTGTASGSEDVMVSGTIASGGAVTVSSASGAVTLAGATSGGAANNITVTAAGMATVADAVTSTGGYTVSGSGVSLGGAGVTQTAAGDVLIKSTTGDISVAGALTADSSAVGTHVLVLDSSAAISGGGNLSAGTLSDVLVAVSGDVTLGTITANQFASTASTATPTATFYETHAIPGTVSTPGAIILGAVTTKQANSIASTSTTSGDQDVSVASDTSTTGAVALASVNNVTVGGLSSGGTGDIAVTATGGVATIGGPVISTRDYIVVAGTNVVLGQTGVPTTQTAQQNMSITASGGTITALGQVGLISNSTSGSVAPLGTLTLTAKTGIGTAANPSLISIYGGPVAGNDASRRAITLDVTSLGGTGSIYLGTVRGASLTGPAAVPLLAGGPVALGDVDVLSDLSVTSAAALSLISGVATGDIALGGTTIALGVAGATKSLTTATPATTVTLTASAGGAAAVTTHGNFAISAPGAVTIQQLVGTPANITQDDSLAITGSSVSVGDVNLAATPPTLVGSGSVVLTANGALPVDDVVAGVVTARDAVTASSAHGSVTLGGAVSGTAGAASHDITVTAATNADVTGTVTSAGNYTVLAHGVTLGSATAGIIQSAAGNVYVRSGSNIFASGTVVSDSGGVGGQRLVLDASALFNSGFGPVNLRAGPASGAPTSDILLSFGSGNNLVLGAVAGNSLSAATASATPTSVSDYTPIVTAGVPTLQSNAAITIGTVATVQSNLILSHGTVAGQRDVTLAGDTSTTGSVEVGSDHGAVSITGLVSAHTSADLHATAATDLLDPTAGTLSVASVKAFGGNATLVGRTGIVVASGNDVAVLGDASFNSDGAVVAGDVLAGGTITVGGVSGSTAASLTGGSLQANGAISVATTGTIDLTGGTTVATERKLLNTATLTAFDGAPSAADANVTLTSGDAIHVAALASTGGITLDGAGAVTAPGTVTAGDGMTLAGSGNYTVIGGNVLAGGAGVTQAAIGNVLVRSMTTDIAAAGTLTAGGRLVLDSAAAIDGVTTGPSVATASLVAGTDILLRNGTVSPITLGNINAGRLASATSGANPMAVADYTPMVTNGVGTLQSSGALTLGTVSTAQSNAILAIGLTQGQRNVTLAGDTSTGVAGVGGSVEVGSTFGAVSITGLVSANTSANLHADGAGDPLDPTAGTLSVATVQAFGGDATLLGGKGITVGAGHPVAALDNVNLLSGGAIVVDAVRAGGIITVAGVTPGSGAASLSENGLAAHGGISITTTGAIDVTPSGLSLSTPRPQIDANLAGFTTNPNNTDTASIALTSTTSSVKAAGITATGSITLDAATIATVTGNVEAGASGGSGDYIVIGAQVMLGGAATTQKATGDVWLRSTSGEISLAGTIVADDAGTGGRRLVLDSAGAIGQVPTAIPGSPLSPATLVAGAAAPAHRSDVLIRQGDDTQPITLGSITANQLATAVTTATPPLSVADYTVPVANTLTTAGSIALGAVNTLQSSMIVSTGIAGVGNIVIGGDTSSGAVVLTSNNGSITANGPVVATTSVDLSAAGALTVGDITANNGHAALTGGTIGATAGTHAITASGTVSLESPGAITLTADAVSGAAIAVGGISGTNSVAGSFAADSLDATGPIAVATSGDITLAGAHATSLVTSRPTPITADGNAALTSGSGAITIKDAMTTGSLSLDAATAAIVTGVVTVGDVATLVADRNYSVTGGTITLGAPGIAQTATGNIQLASPGTIGVSALLAGGTITADGLTAGSGAGSFSGATLQANGAINITTNGAIALTGTGAAETATERAAFSPTLRTFSGGNVGDADVKATSLGGTITAADLASTGNLSLTATGLATATGIVTVGDAATATVDGDYSVNGGTILLGAPGVVQSATGLINLESAGSIGVSTLLAGGSIFAEGPGGATPLAGSFAGTTLQANGAIGIATTGAITLTGTGTAKTATERTVFDPTLRTFTVVGVPAAADQNIGLASSLGAVSAADLASTGSITVSAGGAVSVSGTVAAGDGSTQAGHGNYSVSGTSIALGGSISGQAALGNIGLQTPGAITLTALRAGGTITAQGVPVGVTPTNAASLAGDSLEANGAITVATKGAITLAGVHAASVVTERQLIDPNLGGFNGAATAGDASVSLTATGINVSSTPGTISVNGGSSTGNIVLTAGTTGVPVGHGGISVTGTFNAGDSQTASGSGDFTATAYDIADASAATINARHSVGVASQTNDALIGTATAGLNPQGGSITAQTFAAGPVHGSTGAVASIQSATTTLGDIQALATGAQGTASIVSGTATQGSILADGNAASTITLATTLGASGDITAHSQSGNATVTSGTARGNVSALAGSAALVGTGVAANGNVNALGGTTATITSGIASSSIAALGNVRATSTGGGLATIATGSAAQSVIASGGRVLVGSATAGDDIVLIASTGTATATTLTVTGAAATEAAATDASGAALAFGGSAVTGLGGSNVIIRASGAATVSGVVSVTQANVAKSANYDIQAGSVALGTNGAALNQGAAGRVDIAATGGDVLFAGTGGLLTSNVGGNRVANGVAGVTVAEGGLTLAATGNVSGATTSLVATARALPGGYDVRADQPGVVVTAGGSIGVATITGGPVTVTAPVVVDVPLVTSWGDVVLAGSSSLTDTAIIMPVQVVIDGLNAGATNHALAYAPANVTVAGGGGAEVASLSVANGGLVGALQVLSNSGAATLRATPSDPTKIASILVGSQTGVAGILNTIGGPASSANPNTVAAQNIVLRGGQTGSSVIATGPLLATGSIIATGPSVTVGTAAVIGTTADGSGDILIAATNSASLAAGATETAVARRTINVTGGAATLGDGTATGGTLAVSGTTVSVLRNAVAGDDVVLTSLGPITATNAVIQTTGTADLQTGDDTAGLSVVSVGAAVGTGYGAGHMVGTNVQTTDIDAVTGGSLTRLAGSNIVVTAAGNIDLGAAALTATTGRDIHIEATGTVALAAASAARQFIGASGGTFTSTGSIAAGDDLVIGSGAAIDVRAATLSTTGGAAGATDARRADGTLLAVPVAGGVLTNLAGNNIALAAAGPIELGAIVTSAAPSSLRAFSGAAITTTQAIVASGDIALVGATVTDAYALTAGDDIVVVARGGTATLSGSLTTTGTATSSAALVDLAGNGVSLPGESALGRVDGSSILVAATGAATVSTTVASAGRYSVYGRGGIVLGTAGAATSQAAAGDVLLEASIGAAPAPASVTLADGMVLTANSDGIEAARVGGFVADPLVIRVGNGSVAAAGATVRVLRTPNATLADQGTVQIQPVVADGVTSIAIQTLDSASADLRALGDVTIGSANVDAGLTLASKAGAVALTTLTVGTSVPLMTAAQVAAIDVNLSGATGAALGTVTTGANLVRDITVATVGGDAAITTASARDDIVIASTNGRAIAGDLTFAGTASDSEAGVTTVAATDADGVALPDPYGLTGTTITGLAGRNIVVSGATAASLNSVTTAASDNLGDVRVLTAAGPATLTTVNTGGAGLPGRVIVATRNGVATGTTLNARGDIIVDATAGSAVLTSGNAGRDGIVVAPTVSIGNLTVGDDIVAVATGGTLTAGTLVSTGTNSGDGITTIFRADGTGIVDPVAGGTVGNLAGGNVVALATGDVTVTTATATAASGATTPGLVRLGSQTGTVSVTGATATAGDLVLTGPVVTATTLSAGRDATITTTGVATLPLLTAGRDITITAASADLADGGLVAAQRNLSVTTTDGLTIGTARAGGMLTATGGTVVATTLVAGDAVTVIATTGDATVATATSTGLPLLADFSGFAPTGTASGSMRDVSVTAAGNATLGTATAVNTIALTGGTTATLTTATASFVTVTAGIGGATIASATAGQDFTVNAIGPTTIQQASAGRDASITVTGSGATTINFLTAGRDATVVAGGTASLGADTGLIAAQRNLTLTAANLAIGTARAGEALTATGGTVTAMTLASGDALTVNATGGDATVTSASSTGLPLLADYSGFAAGGSALGATRDITVNATGAATVTTASAAHSISISGDSAAATTATANTGGTDGDLTLTGATAGATLGTGSGRDVLVTTTSGDVTVGSAAALRDIVLTTADGTATLTAGMSGRDTRVTGSDVTVIAASADTAAVGGDLVLVATGADAVLGQGTGRDISITAAGNATATTATASRDLIMMAPAVTLTTGVAGNNIALTGDPSCCQSGSPYGNIGGHFYGTVNVGSATANTAGGGGILQSYGNTTLQFGSGYDVDIVGDTHTLATLVAAHDVSTTSTFDTTIATVSAGHSISVAGSSVAVTTATANLGGTDGDLAVAADQGNATLTTGSGRDVRVTAIEGGSAQAGTITATRDLFVDARALDGGTPGGTASLGTGTAGRDAVIVGPTVAVGSATAAANVVAVADAGPLTATTLTSTGATDDGLATIARADGTPVLDPTAGGSPAIGGLAGGNVVALAGGDLTVGTATAAPGATAPGLVRLASLGTTTVATATATAGDIIVTGGLVAGGTLSAGRDATVTAAGGDVGLTTVGSGRDLVLTASNDVAVSGSATAGGRATLNAGRDIDLGATATGDALDVGGDAALVSGRDIVVARPVAVGLALTATAGGAGNFAGTTSGGATTIATRGDLILAADTAATGALTLTSATGAITAPDISGNGITLTAATAGTVTNAATSSGDLTATGGSLSFGTIAKASTATLHATGALVVSGSTTTSGSLTATSDAGSIAMGAVTTGGSATITASDASNGSIILAGLGTTGAATLLAGQSAAVTGLAQTSGMLTATGTDGGLSFGAIDSGAAATLRARTAIAVAGLAHALGTLDARSTAGAVTLGATKAATVLLRGATGVAIAGGTTATGPVTITADAGPVTTGDIAAGAATNVTATTGAITLASVSQTAGLTLAAATDATVTGDINSSGDVGVTASSGSATLGSVSNAGKLTLAAATNAILSGSVQTSADTAITATNGSATVGGAVKTANYTIKADNGTITLGSAATATQASSGTVTLDSQRLTLNNGVTLVASKQIQLDVTGNAAGVSLGDFTGATIDPTRYTLSNAGVRALQSPIVQIAAGGLPVDIGALNLDGVTPVSGGFAGITNALGIATTGNIRVSDALTFTSDPTAPRVLTVGGIAAVAGTADTAVGGTLDKTTPTANAIEVLAMSDLNNAKSATGGQIDATGSIVQLRAAYIALGETLTPPAGQPFITALLPAGGTPLTTAATKTQYVDNASSTLYVAIPPYAVQTPTPQALVTAGTLVLAPGQWALIQNTGPTTTPGGGIVATTLKLNKVAGAAAPDPEIAVFGSIAGKTGVASAISVGVDNLDGISPNNIRVNGCVALSTAGCIQSAISIPLINLADPGQSLLISSSPDLALSVELITGATNEALWREDDDAPGQNRPQRESRP